MRTARSTRSGTRSFPRAGLRAPAMVIALAVLATACSGDDGNEDISVFNIKAGQCFTAPKSVKVQLSTLNRTECTKKHTLEAYAVTQYVPAGARLPSGPPSTSIAVPTGVPTAKPSVPKKPSTSIAVTTNYPGEDVLKKFADGTCAQRFGEYVGVDYLDSKLFFTYLLPSARSWEQADDRNVLCFVTTTGGTLTKSVKDSKR